LIEYREDMPHPIKDILDRIIIEFYTRKFTYSQAKHQIDRIVDEEVEKVERENEKVSRNITYKTIISIGEAKKNALIRLKRRARLKGRRGIKKNYMA
jgi:hypothetical protein